MSTVTANNRLFIDLDGTLADFTGQFYRHFNIDHHTLSQPELKQMIVDHGSFYRDMALLPGALDFFNRYRYLDPIFLGACLKESFAIDAVHKREWVHQILSEKSLFIPCYGSSSKHLYLQKPNDILVDDWAPNIERWTAAGGIGIHHRGDFTVTQQLLDEALRRPATVESMKTIARGDDFWKY